MSENRGVKPFPSPLSGPPLLKGPPPDSNTYEFCGSQLLSRKDVEAFGGKKYLISQGELYCFPEFKLSDIGWDDTTWLLPDGEDEEDKEIKVEKVLG